MRQAAAVSLLILIPGCLAPPIDDSTTSDETESYELSESCSTTTRYLTEDGWVESPADAIQLDFDPGTSTVETGMTLSVIPPIERGYRWNNGSVSYGSTETVAKTPGYPWGLLVRELNIQIDSPSPMEAGYSATHDFSRHILSDGREEPITTIRASSFYDDPYPEGGVYLATHSDETPSYLEFTYCPED